MRSLMVAVMSLVLVMSVATGAYAEEMGRYLVKLKGSIGNAVGKAGGNVLHTLGSVGGLSIEVPEAAIEGLKRNPNVEYIRADIRIQAIAKGGKGGGKKPPKDDPTPEPSEVLEWNVDQIDAEKAWSYSTGAGSKVAVVDTGIDKDHPDLAENIAGGRNYVRKGRKLSTGKWDDDNGHGTHVAGIIAALDNEIGVIGVAPEAQLYGVKVLDSRGNGWMGDLIAALEWAVTNNMDVVNMSLSASEGDPLLESACQSAADAGILLVAASGNNGGQVQFPAQYGSVIAVGATNSSDQVTSWSNKGSSLEIVAPGLSVRSTWKGGSYETLDGTSMATPHVAGVCALMRGLPESLAPEDPRTQLQITADDLYAEGRDTTSGFGLVDAEEAVTGAESAP